MEDKNDNEKMDEILLPGFRFHPTDEELVGFYLKRKIQQQPPSIELIRQLDIYKYDPWDLPKLASTGEKEWYFYCPRDRKYRNSARPNRVTGAGFWKATGTDRPIYSSESSKCIGLKKSLVFYKGRAAKGVKTDWMMHEFRLPSLTDPSQPKRYIDKIIPASDSWAIVRIFKKTNSNAQRALSNSWVSPLPEFETGPQFDESTPKDEHNSTQFNSDNMPFSARTSSAIPFCYYNSLPQSCTTTNYSPIDFGTYKLPSYPLAGKVSHLPVLSMDIPASFLFSPLEASGPTKCTVDVPSMMLNMSSAAVLGGFGKYTENIGFHGSQEQTNGFLFNVPQDVQANNTSLDDNGHLDTLHAVEFPFSTLPMNMGDNAWKPDFLLDSSSCPSEMSSNFCTTKCYT